MCLLFPVKAKIHLNVSVIQQIPNFVRTNSKIKTAWHGEVPWVTINLDTHFKLEILINVHFYRDWRTRIPRVGVRRFWRLLSSVKASEAGPTGHQLPRVSWRRLQPRFRVFPHGEKIQHVSSYQYGFARLPRCLPYRIRAYLVLRSHESHLRSTGVYC